MSGAQLPASASAWVKLFVKLSDQTIVMLAETDVVVPATDSVKVLLAVVSAVPTGIAALFETVITGDLSRTSVGPTVHVTSYFPVAVLHVAETESPLLCANAAGTSTAAPRTAITPAAIFVLIPILRIRFPRSHLSPMNSTR